MIVPPRFVVVTLLALAATGTGADKARAQGIFRGKVLYANGNPVGLNEVEVKVYCMNSNNQVVELGSCFTQNLNPMLGTNFSAAINSPPCASCSSNVLVSFKQLSTGTMNVYATNYLCSNLVNTTITWNPPQRLNYNKMVRSCAPDDLSATTCCETTCCEPSFQRAVCVQRRRGLFGCRR